MKRRLLEVFAMRRMMVLLPFAFMTVFALFLAAPAEGGRYVWEGRAAIGLTLVLVTIGFAVPWDRLPSWTHPTIPLAYFGVIVLLRDAHGGAASGYGPLCVMPVFWLAVFGTRKQLALALAILPAVFIGPIVWIGGDQYPTSGWRGGLLWVLVMTIVGYRVQALVSDIKRRAAISREHAVTIEQHARELADTQASLEVMARLAREIPSAANARDMVCQAAMMGAEAAMAILVEPDGNGGFRFTGSAGIPLDLDRIQDEARPSASLRAFYSREREFVADVSTRDGMVPLLIEATGLASIVFEPIVRFEKPVAVLCVGWGEARSSIDDRTSAVISYLAAEAGAAIERADLVTQLDQLARTDQLTGLPNRRSWDENLQQTIAGRAGDPFCVAIIDLDHFKHYNDRYGHPAGDLLLHTAAGAWRAVLRSTDVLARYGGEEFAVLLPNGSLDDAAQVLERLRAATPTVTCSVGLAERRQGETVEELMARATTRCTRRSARGATACRPPDAAMAQTAIHVTS